MQFDQLLEQVEQSPESIIVDKSWSQGRTLFGGLSAALLLHAVRQKISSERVLRSLTTHFVGPIAPEQAFSIEVNILRKGRNMTMTEARVIQDGKVATTIHAVFGQERKSKISVQHEAFHDMPQPKKAKFIPQIPGVTPKFLKHIDLAIVDGGTPFTGSKKSHCHGWMRFSDKAAKIQDAHVVALIDAWPPKVLQMVLGPAPASSVTWNLEFVHPHNESLPGDWFAYQGNALKAESGYAHEEAHIWNAKGEMVAISRQLVAIFD